MNSDIKRSIITIIVHCTFPLLIYFLNTYFPNSQKGAPDMGILALYLWYIYAPIATLKTIFDLAEGRKEKLFPMLINSCMLIFLAIVYFTFDTLEYFVEYF